jgi:hypothetical protein
MSAVFPHLRTSRYLSNRTGIVLRDVSYNLNGTLHNLDHFLLLLSLLLMRGPNNFLLASLSRHFFKSCHDWELSIPALDCPITETYRHPNGMYRHYKLVHGVESSV